MAQFFSQLASYRKTLVGVLVGTFLPYVGSFIRDELLSRGIDPVWDSIGGPEVIGAGLSWMAANPVPTVLLGSAVWLVIAATLSAIHVHRSAVREPNDLSAVARSPLTEGAIRTSDSVIAQLAGYTLFYDQDNPNCYQPGGLVAQSIIGGQIPSDETIYRLGIRSSVAMERCRIILQGSEPMPHNPGQHRLGLAMRPRIPIHTGSEQFTVNPDAPAYVDVLQEISPQSNPNQPAWIRLIYNSKDSGQAKWFEPGDYVETFRLEGPSLRPATLRLAVEFDGRREYRRWRVKAAD